MLETAVLIQTVAEVATYASRGFHTSPLTTAAAFPEFRPQIQNEKPQTSRWPLLSLGFPQTAAGDTGLLPGTTAE